VTAVLVCTPATVTPYSVAHALDAHRAVEIDARPGTSARLAEARRAEDRRQGR
jgi:hypothetical protein